MERLVIPDECFDDVMDEVSRAVGKALEKPFDKREEREAFYVFTASLRTLAEERFRYLPEDDRKDIVAFCGTWVNVGILLGKSPGILADILKKTSLRTEEAE
jgi:hypothetical protein